jgi:hypothetical protein
MSLVIEQCLIDGLIPILNPEKVSDMTTEMLDRLGSESVSVKERRESLETREKELEELLELCKSNPHYSTPRKYNTQCLGRLIEA